MNQLQAGKSWSGVFEVTHRCGHTFDAFVMDTPVRNHAARLVGIIGVSENITPRREAIEALTASEERFRQAAETVPNMIFTFDSHGRPDYVNDRFHEYTGLRSGDAIDGAWIKCVHPRDRYRLLKEWVRARSAARTVDIQHRLRRHDGLYRWFISRARPFRDESGFLIRWFGTSTDIDDLRSAEQEIKALNSTLESRVLKRTAQVRALSAALTLAEQRERSKITRYLHDEIQQLLYAVKLKSDVIEDEVADPSLRARFADVAASLDHVIEAIRSLTIELSPPLLHGEGLDVALEWLAAHMERSYGLIVRIEAQHNGVETNERRRSLLYQIVRELLFNVVKHAGVSYARVHLSCSDGVLTLVVEDDGVGFDPAALPTGGVKQTLGLTSARERIELVGGLMSVDSAPSMGTRITITSPAV